MAQTRFSTSAIPSLTGTDAIALTPDGKTAYVTGESAPGVITPVDLANGRVGQPIPVAAGDVWGIAISPDGSTAYVTAATGDGVAPDVVLPVDLATGNVGTPITLPGGPGVISVGVGGGIAISPDGTTAYVTTSPSARGR